MRIRIGKAKDVKGSVLMITLIIALILGLGLVSYLTLVHFQHLTAARTTAWNASLSLAEAGVEEALAQLNPAALLFNTNIDRGANGWSLGADGMYHAPRRTITNGSVNDGAYDVAMTSDPLPIIYATGYVTIPTLSATIVRSVKATTDTTSIYRSAVAARAGIDLKGNGVSSDSFNSLDPNKSTDGLYDPAKRQPHGDIASVAGIINVQNANIMGTLFTGPAGSFSVGANGTVGDVAWVLGGNTGIQPGHYKNDFNMDFPPVKPPYQSGLPPLGTTLNGTNYTWAIGDGAYMVDNPKTALKFGTGDTILVTGRASVYVTGDFIMAGQSQIVIAPGASLQLYVGGANGSITSVNNSGNCATFSYFGLPGHTSLSLSGNNSFLGNFYAPSASLSLSGGGSSDTDFQGVIAVNTIQMNGHFNFHFDENLQRKGPVRGYHITSWTEL